MKLKAGQEAAFEAAKANNQDGYGSCIYRYAEKWADLMEAQVATGAAVGEIAKETSHAADVEGITGFMYGAAVSVLSAFWEAPAACAACDAVDEAAPESSRRPTP